MIKLEERIKQEVNNHRIDDENKLLTDYTSHTEYKLTDKPRKRATEINYTYNKLLIVICVFGLVFMVGYWL